MSRLIRVLHLIDTYRVGGPGKTIINSAKYIERGRYRVHVSSFTSADSSRNEFTAAVKAEAIPYLPLPETRRVNLSHVGVLRAYIKEHGVAILHTHGYRSDVIGYLATRGCRAAIVTTHHGWIRNNRRQHVLTRLALQMCRRFDGVELVSEQMRSELPPGLQRSGRVSVVRNGIVLADYQPDGRRDAVRASLGVSPNERLVGVIGRLSVEKGCFQMLDAFRIVATRMRAARLVFVGEGPLRARLEQRVTELGLSEAVRFAPYQPRVQPLFEAIDLLVSPSHSEGLSNVILESLAMRRPVVATRVGGNAEIVDDGISGVLVEPGAYEQLADAIERVLTEPELCGRLVAGGADRVGSEFAFDVRMRREERFYEDALGRAGLRTTSAHIE